jgi:O-antigen/teichoic acid export membrane protein
MQSNRSFKVVVMALGNGINILINFLTLPYLVRSLTLVDYGTYGQVLIVLSLLQGIFTFSLNQISNIYLARNEQPAQVVFSTIMRTGFILSLIGGGVMLLTVPLIANSFDNAALNQLLYLSVLNLVGQIPVPILLSVLIFYGRVKHTTSTLIFTNILKILVMFASIYYFNSVKLMMIGLSIVSIIQVLTLFACVPKELRTLKHFEKSLSKEIFFLAVPLAITSIIEKSVLYIDGVMISTMLSTTDFAVYRAGAIEVPFIASLYGSVAAIVMPEVARYFTGGNHMEILKLKRKVVSITAFFVYPVLIYLLFFSGPIITFYLSEKYAASSIIFAIFNLSLLIRVNDHQDIIVVSGNSKFIFYSIFSLAFLNVILNYILISAFGIIGSAIAFILHLFLFTILLTYKTMGVMSCTLNDLFDVKKLIWILLLSLFLIVPLWLSYKFLISSVFFILCAAPFYLLSFVFIGIKFDLVDRGLYDQFAGRFIKLIKR